MSVSGVLRKAFPFISAAASLGGPLGVMAATAVGDALHLDKPLAPNEISISNVITSAFATPEQRAALQKAEQDFQLQMAQLGYHQVEALDAMAVQDRASARAREIAVKDWTPQILGYSVVALTIFGEGYVLIHGTPPALQGVVLGRILGTMDAALMLVLGYYFGSSIGSTVKSETIANLAQGPPQNPVEPPS